MIGRGEEGRRSGARHETLVDTLYKLEGRKEGGVLRCEDGEEVKGRGRRDGGGRGGGNECGRGR